MEIGTKGLFKSQFLENNPRRRIILGYFFIAGRKAINIENKDERALKEEK